MLSVLVMLSMDPGLRRDDVHTLVVLQSVRQKNGATQAPFSLLR
jgi:hypothetical protein